MGYIRKDFLIAEIKSLDVAPDGRLLIDDLMGQQGLLFEADGVLSAVLDPSVCHPGFETRPVNAVFAGTKSIFLANAGPWGYKFTTQGRCTSKVDPDYALMQTGFLDATDDGDLFDLYRMPDYPVVRHMTSNGQTLQEITLPASAFPNATRRISMGGLVVDEAHIFHAGAVEPHILKLTRNGEIVAKFSRRNSWFRPVRSDAPSLGRSNPAAQVQAAGRIMVTKTTTSRILD